MACALALSTVGTAPQARGRRRGRRTRRGRAREQPRRRGDDYVLLAMSSSTRGTAPQARGRPVHLLHRHASSRNSPAGAGTTRRGGGRRCRPREQPRRRGDDLPVARATGPTGGTAPQARGRRISSRTRACSSRNSPAGAGTTPGPGSAITACRPEQPRRRGDDVDFPSASQSKTGTAPQARGRQPTLGWRAWLTRNSPAGAGTTTTLGFSRARMREQPRRRGDDADQLGNLGFEGGTAPQARGRHAAAAGVDRMTGNSPAGAGTTSSTRSRRHRTREQPRRRGDDTSAAHSWDGIRGTAPQARGRRTGTGSGSPINGNSPAGAGTTAPMTRSGTRDREQPRRRGDDSFRLPWYSLPSGTAPQARGRHAAGRGVDVLDRNSPAGAGTTTRPHRIR